MGEKYKYTNVNIQKYKHTLTLMSPWARKTGEEEKRTIAQSKITEATVRLSVLNERIVLVVCDAIIYLILLIVFPETSWNIQDRDKVMKMGFTSVWGSWSERQQPGTWNVFFNLQLFDMVGEKDWLSNVLLLKFSKPRQCCFISQPNITHPGIVGVVQWMQTNATEEETYSIDSNV